MAGAGAGVLGEVSGVFDVVMPPSALPACCSMRSASALRACSWASFGVAAAWAMDNNQLRTKSERVTRATAILFALESGLDFERGGEVSNTLARLYAGIRRTVVDASVGTDSAPFRDAASSLSEIAEAWRTARAA